LLYPSQVFMSPSPPLLVNLNHTREKSSANPVSPVYPATPAPFPGLVPPSSVELQEDPATLESRVFSVPDKGSCAPIPCTHGIQRPCTLSSCFPLPPPPPPPPPPTPPTPLGRPFLRTAHPSFQCSSPHPNLHLLVLSEV